MADDPTAGGDDEVPEDDGVVDDDAGVGGDTGGDDGFSFDDDDVGADGTPWDYQDDQFQDNGNADDLLFDWNDYLNGDRENAGDDDDDGAYSLPEHDTYTTATNSNKESLANTLPQQQQRVATPPKIATARVGPHDKEHPILLIFLLVGIALVLTLQSIVKRSSPSATYKRDDGDSVPLVKNGESTNGVESKGGKRKQAPLL